MKYIALFLLSAACVFAQSVAAPFTAKVGQQVQLLAVADGATPFTYQWRKGGSNISGATVNPLLITIKDVSDAGSYDVILKNQYGSATSAAGILNVTTPIVAPSITMQPVNAVIPLGGNTGFSIAVSGTGPFIYQWYKNGVIIPPSTGPSIFINGATVADVGTYTCVVTNAAGSVTSNPAALAVTVPVPSNITITFSIK